MMSLASLPPIGVVYFAISVITILFTLLVGSWLRSNYWDVRGVKQFLVLLLSGGIVWPGIVAYHVVTADRAIQNFVVTAELGLGISTAIAWIWFVSVYTDHGVHRTLWIKGGAAATTLLYLTLVATNPSHHLLFADIVHIQAPFSHGSAVRGPVYFVVLGAIYVSVAIANYILIEFLSSAGRSSPASMLLLGLGSVSLVSLNVLTILDFVPIPGFEHASFGASPFLLFTTISVFRFRLLQIAPVARTTLLESLTDPMIVVDERQNVADYNKQSTRLWPDIDEHVGDPFAETCPTLAEEIEFPDDGEEAVEQLSMSTIDGHRHFSVLLSPVAPPHENDDTMGYAILLRDVTELEESRKELEHQNKQLDRVSATISHDLRNPLNVADGYADILFEDLATADADMSAELDHLQRVTDAHDRMEAIIDDILTLAKEGKTVEDPEPVDFKAVAQEAWCNVDHKRAVLTVQDEGTIEAERSRLLSIFENMFRNTIEHCGPTVEVEVGIDESAGQFYVQDDGPGIPSAKVDEIFEYGYTDSESGTGLGLSIVETMAESHGWSVAVDTTYDLGARFVFSDVSFTADSPSRRARADDREAVRTTANRGHTSTWSQ